MDRGRKKKTKVRARRAKELKVVDISSSDNEENDQKKEAPKPKRRTKTRSSAPGITPRRSSRTSAVIASAATASVSRQPRPGTPAIVDPAIIKDLKVCPKTCKCPHPTTYFGCTNCSRIHKTAVDARAHRSQHKAIPPKPMPVVVKMSESNKKQSGKKSVSVDNEKAEALEQPEENEEVVDLDNEPEPLRSEKFFPPRAKDADSDSSSIVEIARQQGQSDPEEELWTD